MAIDNLTIGQLKEITKMIGGQKQDEFIFPYSVGDNIFIRTVTMYYLGKIKELKGQWIVLDEASWISDTGRFHDFLKDGKCNEYEGFIDPVSIPMNSIIDITPWRFSLFKGQK